MRSGGEVEKKKAFEDCKRAEGRSNPFKTYFYRDLFYTIRAGNSRKRNPLQEGRPPGQCPCSIHHHTHLRLIPFLLSALRVHMEVV